MLRMEKFNKILLILVVILIGVIIYLILIKNKSSNPESIPNETSEIITPVNWENKISAIRKAIGPEFLGAKIEESYPLGIFQATDITGDGVEEALVDLGSGGAYISSLALMRMENGQPVVARFKQKDGTISSLMLLAGASVMNGENTVLWPEERAIYLGHWERDPSSSTGELAVCETEAYQWNSKTKTFDFSANLGKKVQSGFCQKINQTQE